MGTIFIDFSKAFDTNMIVKLRNIGKQRCIVKQIVHEIDASRKECVA